MLKLISYSHRRVDLIEFEQMNSTVLEQLVLSELLIRVRLPCILSSQKAILKLEQMIILVVDIMRQNVNLLLQDTQVRSFSKGEIICYLNQDLPLS